MYLFRQSTLGIAAGLAFSLVSTVALAVPQSYGDARGLSPSQVVSAIHLDFSNGQSYGAIVDLLGMPDARDRRADWYSLPNGGGYMLVNYQGAIAVGLSWSSQP